MAVYPQFRRSVDFMKKMKDTIQSQLPTLEKTTMAVLAANSYVNYAGFSVPMATTAQFASWGITPSPRTIEAEWLDWADVLHNAGIGIIFRPAFPTWEGIYNAPYEAGAARYPLGTFTTVVTNGDHASMLGRVYDWIIANEDCFNDAGSNPDVFAFSPERTENSEKTRTILSITRSGTAATVTTTGNHDMHDNYSANTKPVQILGADQAEYNGAFVATITSGTTFTIQVAGSPATPATGSMQVKHGYNIYNDALSPIPHSGGINANFVEFYKQMNLVAAAAFVAIGKPGIIMGDSANNYSEPRSGWIFPSMFSDAGKIVVDYYLNYNGDGYTATQAVDDLLYLYDNRGQYRIAWQEYGPIQTYGQSDAARAADLQLLVDEVYTRMVVPGKMEEMNFWVWWEGQNTSFLTKTGSGASAVYALNPMGEVMKQFFKTIYEQTVPPDAPSGLSLATVSSSAIDVSWTDNSTTETGFKIERKTGAGGTYTQVGTVAPGITIFSDTGLSPNTEYYYRVRSYNNVGNSTYTTEASAFTDLPTGGSTSVGSLFGSPLFGSSLFGGSAGADNTPPEITNVAISLITHNSVRITWDTNEPATSRVKYGLTTSYGTLTANDTNLVTSHQVDITGLTPATPYHFRVVSVDQAGNLTQSADAIFTTDYPPVPPPFISNVAVVYTTLDTARISWNTLTNSSSQVQYGLTTAYGSETTNDATGVTSHQVDIAGLTPGTVYHFRVRSVDGGAVEYLSGDFVMVTQFGGDIPPIIFRKKFVLRAPKTKFVLRAPKRSFKVRVPNY